MKDVAPELRDKIVKRFNDECEKDTHISRFKNRLESGKATQQDVTVYNRRLAAHASDALRETLKEDNLPDGKLYYNIASRTVVPTIQDVQGLTEEAEFTVIRKEYQARGIGLKPQKPKLNEERINEYVSKLVNVSAEGDKAKVEELLGGPFQNICESYANEYVDTNAQFAEKSGMKAKISRQPLGKCCEWCEELAGTYDYATAPHDVYRRHDNCTCVVTYEVEKKVTDVWSKKQFNSAREARIAREQQMLKQAEERKANRGK